MFLAGPPDNSTPLGPIPFDPDAGRPQFPVFILGAPGVICLLALAMSRELAHAMKSGPAIWTATLIASVGAIACFWIIAARSREHVVRVPATLALIGAILLSLRAVLSLL